MPAQEEKIPPFVQDYLDKMEHEGYPDFVKLSREYHKEREEFPGKFATQSARLNEFNRATGQNRQLNYEEGLSGVDNRYKQRAYQLAKQHGYKGPDPTQPSDKDFTKQGEKFMGMIDHARQRQHESEQMQETERSHEKKNIEALKSQHPYQQNQPEIKFEGIKQESREQQRAAFLAQVKATREQQAGQQRDDPSPSR